MNTSSPFRVAIIGGGISGMTAALRLGELAEEAGTKGLEIHVFEAAPQLGGLVASEQIGDYLIERGADSFITNKPAGVNLCRKLGLEADLIGTDEKNRRSLILSRGKPIETPAGLNLIAPGSAWSILKTPILSLKGKLRVLCEPFIQRRPEYGDESLGSFTRRRLGQEMLDRIVQPMVGGIYTADPEKLSLQATLPRFLEMERKYGSLFEATQAGDELLGGADKTTSGARYGMFVSLRNGMSQLIQALESRVRSVAQVHCQAQVQEISLRQTPSSGDAATSAQAPKCRIVWTDAKGTSQQTEFSAVILATPAHEMSRVLKSANPEAATALAQIEYASSAIIITGHDTSGIDHPLNAFGLVIPAIEKRKILSVSFLNRKFPTRAPARKAILRTFIGGALQPEMMDLTDDQLIDTTLSELRSIFGVRSQPEFAVVARYTKAMPQYHVGHLDRVARITQSLSATPWVDVAGNTLGGVGLPDSILSGEKAAERIWAAIGTDSHAKPVA